MDSTGSLAVHPTVMILYCIHKKCKTLSIYSSCKIHNH